MGISTYAMTDKILQIEAMLVSLQRQVDEVKSNSIRIIDDINDDIERIEDEMDRKHNVSNERFHHIEIKIDHRCNINSEKIHQLEVNQAKIIQAVQLGGYFIKMVWGLCGAVGGAITASLISHLI